LGKSWTWTAMVHEHFAVLAAQDNKSATAMKIQ